MPKPDEIVKIAEELKVKEKDFESLCENEQIKQAYLFYMVEQGKKEGLFPFEQAHKIFLEKKSLVLHGCLTSSFKMQRHNAKVAFKK